MRGRAANGPVLQSYGLFLILLLLRVTLLLPLNSNGLGTHVVAAVNVLRALFDFVRLALQSRVFISINLHISSLRRGVTENLVF